YQIGGDQKSDGVRVPIGTGLIGTAAKEKRPVYVPDVTKDPRYLPCSKKTASELAIPLMVRDEVVGVLDCQSENVDHFDSETIDLLTLFSTQASMALQNARLYSLERRRASQLEAINAIAQQTTAVLDAQELLSKVCMLIQNAFRWSHSGRPWECWFWTARKQGRSIPMTFSRWNLLPTSARPPFKTPTMWTE